MLRRAAALPHDRSSSLVMADGRASPRLARSIDSWTLSLLEDDGLTPPLTARGDKISASIKAKQYGTFAGRLVVARLVERSFPGMSIEWALDDADTLGPGDEIGVVSGGREQILKAERSLLNILGRLSGIATTARAWSLSSSIPIAATRKTTWGLLDKWAVHLGGALTHRLNRDDALMIKENDMAAMHPDLTPIERIRTSLRIGVNQEHGAFIVIETRDGDEALAAARTWAESSTEPRLTIMLDNMGPDQCRAVHDALDSEDIRSQIILEASGGVAFDDLGAWSGSAVDLLSTSAIHRGTGPLDISMLIEEEAG